MRISKTIGAAAVTLAFALTGGAAHAISITAVSQSLPISGDVVADNTLVGTLAGTGSLAQTPGIGTARSPWTGLTSASVENDREFLYLQAGSITVDLDAPANGGLPATSATLLWGSPDSYNTLQLFLDEELVATIVPGDPDVIVPVDPLGTYVVTITDVVFDTLVFSSTAASFEFANVAVTPQYEGELACGETTTEAGNSLRRLTDVGEPETCIEIPYQLDFDGTTLTFLADYGVLEEGTEPAFAFDLDWRTEWIEEVLPASAIPFTVGGPNPPPATPTSAGSAALSVQWFGNSPVPEQPWLLDYCPGDAQYVPVEGGDPLLVGVEFPPAFDESADGANDMSDLPGFQYGCLVSRDVELVADAGECSWAPKPTPNAICVRVKESGYLRGDWTATRTLR